MSGQSESAVNRAVSLTDDQTRVVSHHNCESLGRVSQSLPNVAASLPRHNPMARHRGDDTDAGSSKAQSSSGGHKPDFHEMATTDVAFDGFKTVIGSADDDRAQQP